MIGLGNDAGTANSGYSVIDFKKSKWTYLELGQFESTFKNMTDKPQYKKPTKAQKNAAAKKGKRLTRKDMPFQPAFQESLPIYINAITALFEDWKINFFCAERFQVRSVTQGPTIEMISMMNGIICHMCLLRQIQYRLVIASQWKNQINKIISLEDIYKHAHQYKITPHECDSTGMLLYDAAQKEIMPLEISLMQWKANIDAYARKN